MTETPTSTLPRWIWIYGIVVMIIMNLGLAVVLLVSPRALPPELSGNLVFGGPLGLLVARYFATVLATIFVLYRRSASMILLLFMIRLLTNIPDYTFTDIEQVCYIFVYKI